MTTLRRIAAFLACLFFVSGPSFGQSVVASTDSGTHAPVSVHAPEQDAYSQPADIIHGSHSSDGITEQKDDSRLAWLLGLNGPHVVIPKPIHTFTAPRSDAVSFIPKHQHTGFCSGLAPPTYA